MRSRTQSGTKLTLSMVWDQVSAGFLFSSRTRVENVDHAIQLLTDVKQVRVFMTQARQPLTDRNEREGQAQGGCKGPVEEMGVAELRQELAESSNTIYQLRKNQEPFRRQQRDGWQRNWRGQDQQAAE